MKAIISLTQKRIEELRKICSELKEKIRFMEPGGNALSESYMEHLENANDERDNLERELDRLKQLKSAIDRYEQ